MQDKFKILFIGDIVGRSGRKAVKKFLVDDANKNNYDFIIANAENASHKIFFNISKTLPL